MQAADIRDTLLAGLEPIFGKAKNPEALAGELAKHVADGTGATDLAALAQRMIETRKTKGFPSASELIQAVRGVRPRSATNGKYERAPSQAEADKARDKAEKKAINLLRHDPVGQVLARRAIDESWPCALLQFVRDEGRLPSPMEEAPLIALAHKNDALARENANLIGGVLMRLRRTMIARAVADLTGEPMAGELAGEAESEGG